MTGRTDGSLWHLLVGHEVAKAPAARKTTDTTSADATALMTATTNEEWREPRTAHIERRLCARCAGTRDGPPTRRASRPAR